jgi:ABC-2 type transport system ATP-binding protein
MANTGTLWKMLAKESSLTRAGEACTLKHVPSARLRSHSTAGTADSLPSTEYVLSPVTNVSMVHRTNLRVSLLRLWLPCCCCTAAVCAPAEPVRLWGLPTPSSQAAASRPAARLSAIGSAAGTAAGTTVIGTATSIAAAGTEARTRPQKSAAAAARSVAKSAALNAMSVVGTAAQSAAGNAAAETTAKTAAGNAAVIAANMVLTFLPRAAPAAAETQTWCCRRHLGSAAAAVSGWRTADAAWTTAGGAAGTAAKQGAGMGRQSSGGLSRWLTRRGSG